MKRFCFTTILAVLMAGCASTAPPVNNPSDQSAQAAPHAPVATSRYANNAATKPPVLTVGVSDPNTQLILPWFLADLINAINDP